MRGEPPMRIRANARGSFDVDLPEEERELLALLPGRMLSALEVLANPDSIVPDELRRLFPPAYPTDVSAEDAYVRLARQDLLDHHREALMVLRDSAEVTHLDSQGINAWLTALTDLRLMLGSILGITEDGIELEPSDPSYYNWICYHYLSQLQHEIVTVLSEQLPPLKSEASERLPDDPWGEPLGGLRWDGTPRPELT
ncbi:MAG TPA: DUF2017 family protein [Acidimicrobiales bacterium]|nr:DUF2017 family protein [Acidimicrobiales bacterium]